MLENFVMDHRDELIARCRTKVAARTVPPPSAAEADYGVPLFLSELVDALQRGLFVQFGTEDICHRQQRDAARQSDATPRIHGVPGRARLRRYLPVHH